MKTLYFNPETKVIYASEDAQPDGMQQIANVAVPDLIANGATVDSSADSLLTPSDAGNGSSSPEQSATSSTDSSQASEPGNADAGSADTQSGEKTDSSPNTAATASDGTVTDAGNAPAVESSQSTDSAAADTGSSGASTGSTDAPLSTGTTVDVTQAGDQTVNTNVQNGNQLAGSTGNVLVNDTPTLDAPALDGDTATVTNVENELNPLVPAAGTEGPPATQLAAQADEPEVEPLPRESHLMLLEAKFAAALDKLRNGERVFLEELDAIYEHVKAVL